MPPQKIIKFLQKPHEETFNQPDSWDFQESSDNTVWFDLFWVDPFAQEVPCGVSFDPNSICYHVTVWIGSDTNWVRARAVQEIPLLNSEWSDPLPVPEPPITPLLIVGIITTLMLVFLRKKGFRNAK